MSAYTVTNPLGVFALGQRVENGGTIDLDETTAAPLLATGAIAAPTAPKPARQRAKK